MKTRKSDLFKRITILIFVLITVLSLLFIAITYLTTKEFYQSSTQLVDKDVATHIAEFASPFEDEGLNKRIADSVFYNAMVLNPSIEVYFLDTAGKIMYYQSPDSSIKLWTIPLDNIKKHIQSNGEDYIKGPDPKNPSKQKVFSAAEVYSNKKKVGYIYVILGGNEYSKATDLLFGSHVMSLAITAFSVIIVLSIMLSLFYVNRLQRNFKKIIAVLNTYMKGDFNARFNLNEHNEFSPITDSFNKMAALLSYNIERLKQTEQERKNFIATISHDLRTPLSVAKGYTETAISKMNNGEINRPEMDEFMQLVYKKLQQIEVMVQDLFELSRMESIHFTPNKEAFIFSEILREMYAGSEKAASARNIKMSCNGCEDMSWIHADIRMMERAVQNLLDNAIKYTPHGESIYVNLEKKDDLLTVRFINTGSIISNDLINWINITSNETGASSIIKPTNSGLGLLIVKRILELHDYSFHVTCDEKNIISFIIQMKTANPLSIN
ncbi:MAG: HAMP domain-containing sensor histidine kinase [Parafilimonas sp.]